RGSGNARAARRARTRASRRARNRAGPAARAGGGCPAPTAAGRRGSRWSRSLPPGTTLRISDACRHVDDNYRRARWTLHAVFTFGRHNRAMQPYDAYSYPQAGARGQALGKVLGLLGVAAIFTAIGAFFSPALGRPGFFIGLIGGLGCLIVLNFVK